MSKWVDSANLSYCISLAYAAIYTLRSKLAPLDGLCNLHGTLGEMRFYETTKIFIAGGNHKSNLQKTSAILLKLFHISFIMI